jgi:hypothetical protein
MKKGTVTGEIKAILKDLNLQYGTVYSDGYKNNRVGVKFCRLSLTNEERQTIVDRMERLGFKHCFIKWNNGGYMWSGGTRFCFYNK